MASHFVRFDPETVRLLDRCIARALEMAGDTDQGSRENERRFASALIEATALGERDEDRLVEFALQVLPAYREGRLKRPAQAPAGSDGPH